MRSLSQALFITCLCSLAAWADEPWWRDQPDPVDPNWIPGYDGPRVENPGPECDPCELDPFPLEGHPEDPPEDHDLREVPD
jgi:hypothetical protein